MLKMAYHSDFLRQSPVVSHVDLRDMLRRYIIKQGLDLLKKSDLRREKVISGKFPFQRYKDEIVGFIKEFYGKLPVRNCSSLCKARFVSKFEKKGFRIENVLFDSFPGYPVNATVYIPSDFDPPFPAIVVPTGHSGKQFGSYQLPCQYFARAGYVAVSFDPPGQAGEKQEGNDHFIDGVRCYLVGHTSSRYFVVDALRCIDYLETRKDVDMSFGVAMTGVSGGGTTTMLSSLLDDRIVVQGPSCCAVKNEEINLMWTYANCPETHMYGRYELGIDDTDIIAAFAPRPAMLMAGRYDGLFRIESVRRMAHEIQKVYTAARASENFVFMEDDAPHDYTLNQARAFVGFLNKHFIKQFRPLPPIDSGEYVMIPYDELKCNPPLKSENMRTITVATALQIKKNRSKNKSTLKSIQPVIKKVVMAGKKKLPVLRFKAHEYFNFACWKTRQMLFFDNRGIELPAFYMVPSHNFTSTIVHFDDRDRYSDLVSAGKLTVVAGIYSNKKNCALLSVDLPGWGDTVPSMYPYELYGWGAPDRYISYISAATVSYTHLTLPTIYSV